MKRIGDSPIIYYDDNAQSGPYTYLGHSYLSRTSDGQNSKNRHVYLNPEHRYNQDGLFIDDVGFMFIAVGSNGCCIELK